MKREPSQVKERGRVLMNEMRLKGKEGLRWLLVLGARADSWLVSGKKDFAARDESRRDRPRRASFSVLESDAPPKDI
jgi:hypothetical protein